MSNITSSIQETIDRILKLAGGTVANQIKACRDHLYIDFYHDGCLKDRIDKTVNSIFLPFIIKCTESDNAVLQQDGAYFLDAICSTPDRNKHTKLVIDVGAIPKLIHNLTTSTEPFVLDQTLQCLGKIAARYPRDVIEMNILPSLNVCLKSTDRQVFFHAVKCFTIFSTTCQEKIPDILVADTVESLLKVVETNVNGTSTRYSLVNLLSSASNDRDALKSLKDIFKWLLEEKSKVKEDVALHKSSERKIIKLLAIKFVKNVISLGEAAVDAIFRDGFISSVLQNINAPPTFKEIKPKCIDIIEDIITVKRDSAATLVKDYDVITLLCSNLGSSTEDLRITTLWVLKKVIHMFENEEDKELCRQKIRSCDDDLKKLTKLRKNSNEEVKNFSNSVYDFVVNASSAEVSGDNQNDANDSPAASVLERRNSLHQRSKKRPANTPASTRPSSNKRRCRSSFVQSNRPRSEISVEENDETDMNGDIGPPPPLLSCNDVINVTTNDNSRSSSNSMGIPPPAHLSPITPSSNVTPALPEPASTNNGLNLNAAMHSATTVLSRFEIPLADIKNNLSGHVSPVHQSTTAATATGKIQNSHNSGGRSPFDNSSSSALDTSPVLPQPPSTYAVTTTQSNRAERIPIRPTTGALRTPRSNRGKKSSPPSDNSGTSSSRASSNNSHDLPALPSNGNISNNNPQSQSASSNQTTSPPSNDIISTETKYTPSSLPTSSPLIVLPVQDLQASSSSQNHSSIHAAAATANIHGRTQNTSNTRGRSQFTRSAPQASSALPEPASTNNKTTTTTRNNLSAPRSFVQPPPTVSHGTSRSNPVIKRSPSFVDNNDSPPSRVLSINSPALPEAASTGNETIDSINPSRKPAPSSLQSAALEKKNFSRNNNHFAPFEYEYPDLSFIKKCCIEKFGIKFDRQRYGDTVKRIGFRQISADSKPYKTIPTEHESGFGCISMLFTWSEDSSQKIKEKINENFVSHLIQTSTYNGDKITEVINSAVLLPEHLETLCRWLKCRVMVYCNGAWKKYGSWESGSDLPLFVLEKKANTERTEIVLVLAVDID